MSAHPQPRLSANLLGVAKGDAKATAPTSSAAGSAGKVALTLRITPALHDRLRLAAFEQRRPMQDIILEALSGHLGG